MNQPAAYLTRATLIGYSGQQARMDIPHDVAVPPFDIIYNGRCFTCVGAWDIPAEGEPFVLTYKEHPSRSMDVSHLQLTLVSPSAKEVAA